MTTTYSYGPFVISRIVIKSDALLGTAGGGSFCCGAPAHGVYMCDKNPPAPAERAPPIVQVNHPCTAPQSTGARRWSRRCWRPARRWTRRTTMVRSERRGVGCHYYSGRVCVLLMHHCAPAPGTLVSALVLTHTDKYIHYYGS